MVSSVPMLDVFFIDFETPEEQPESKFSKVLKAAAWFVGGPIAYFTTSAGLKALGADGVSIKRLIDEKRFNIIKTPTELAEFENANNNEWIINEKALRQRQYYIRHPQKAKRNVLIEAKDFYSYIEDEQLEELIHFITSHCPVKSLKIERVDRTESNGRAKIIAEGADLNGGTGISQTKKQVRSQSWPNGAPKVEPRENYCWIKKSIMSGISLLTEGSAYDDEYIYDFTFGLNAAEAKTVGLDMNMHKKFSYTIQIQC